MKSAARLIPSLSQTLRSSVRASSARTLLPLTRANVAGPSSSSLSATRLYATTSIPPKSSLPSDANISGSEVAGPSANGSEAEDVPSNLTFEELEQEADDEITRALAEEDAELSSFFTPSSGRFEPVLLPISSLASPTPTLPSDAELAISLPPDVFAQPIRRDILHRCVVWYLSTLRSGTKTTKTRSTVNYSGRKLRPQKGTGRARLGDASSGVLRGGAPIHPIKPKNWAQQLPRKVRELGLKIALSSKLSSGLLRVVQDLNEGSWTGTNDARRALCNGVVVNETPVELEPILEATEAGNESTLRAEPERDIQTINRFGTPEDLSVLFLHSPAKSPEQLLEFHRVVRNIPGIELMSTDEVEAYHVLKYKWLVMEGGAVDAFSGVEAWEEGADHLHEVEPTEQPQSVAA
ncbi:50S ribosomal protein L4 [Kwoniella heveanensis CBS 569]|nr:50S ribosomal protein L4 [Kwoniella heveanensis CBS 569]